MQAQLIFSNQLGTIDDSKLLTGISLEQKINSDKDFQIGVCGCAQIKFSTTIEKRPAVGDTFQLKLKQYYDADFRTFGPFTVFSSEKNGNKIDVTAYDNICKLDKNVDAWLDGLTFPMSLVAFTNSLASYCGVTITLANDLANRSFQVKDNFTSINLTGRSVLQYIAQLTTGFAKCNSSGVIQVRKYKAVNKTLNRSLYKKATIAEYQTQKIDRVQVNTMNDDIGVVVGSGTNAMVIQNNPLLYAETDQEIRQNVQNIYDSVKDITYTPVKVELIGDQEIEVGDIITVDGVTTYVMKKSLKPSGVTIESTGNKQREQTSDSLNEQINALRGKYNKLSRTLEATVSEVGDLTGNVSTLTQTVEGFDARIQTAEGDAAEAKLAVDGFSVRLQTAEGDISELNQSLDGFSTRLQTAEGDISELDQSLDGFSTRLQTAEGDISTMEQTLEGFDTRIQTAEGDATEAKQTANSFSTRITNAEGDISSIEQTMDGVVLTTSQGRTYINGANIKAGSINLTGEVDWSDFSQDLQNKINNISSDYGDDNVKTLLSTLYSITHTQADGTKIQSPMVLSPQIYGAEIYAGTGNDGYAKMNATGFNLYTKAGGKAVIGLGYQSAGYDYPYIILGKGVDSQGTDRGMIKKFSNGIWIGDNDAEWSSQVGSGDGIFINFTEHKVYKYLNGTGSEIGTAVFI